MAYRKVATPTSRRSQSSQKSKRMKRPSVPEIANSDSGSSYADDINEEGENEENSLCNDKWSCIKWTFVSLALILMVYGKLGFILSQEAKDQGIKVSISVLNDKRHLQK